MSTFVMKKRARRSAHIPDTQPLILPLQTRQEKDQAKFDERGTLQDIVEASSFSRSIMGSSEVAFDQVPEIFVVQAASEYCNILLKSEQFNLTEESVGSGKRHQRIPSSVRKALEARMQEIKKRA